MDEFEIDNSNLEINNSNKHLPIKITIEQLLNGKLEPILTKKELFAWYIYAFACEVYSVVSISSFIPLILEQFAFENGVSSIDYQTPCNKEFSEGVRCFINIFGFWVDTASFSLYTLSLSVILQAITAISIGASADHGELRKTLLLYFAFAGSISAMLFLLIPSGSFIIAGILAIIGNVSFGAAFVCFNGFLPVMIRNHKDVRRISNEIKDYISNVETQHQHVDTQVDDHESILEERGLLNSQDLTLINLVEKLIKTKDHISTHISARGFASGYFGGIILLILCLCISFLLHSTIYSLQIGVFLSGIWWFLFSLLVAKWLQPRPGPPLILNEERKLRWIDYISFSWMRLWKTILEAKKLEMTFRFLMSWILISDGFTTITSVALLFAKTALRIPESGLIILSLIVPVSGLTSTLLLPQLIKLSIKNTILLLLFMLLLIPIYGCLGLILPIGGLRTSGELYIMAVWFGFVFGSLQSYCRTMFGKLVPNGRETEFFALYAITDKGSSWFGPTLVAIIIDITHEIRYGFLLLIALIFLPIPILWSLDDRKGRDDAANFAKDHEDIIQA
ncbi:3614_t:CDS:1 [Funneliformis geosporum]|uniref:Autophagy-related protein n=1 Tax=Funneliformis geosporum TaxID=1117311 RepID=A0A9W4WHY2_9GLOM|nr:3614_t:CDS:1 [Funneliformis geosporum]CAI2163053.1 10025_t:CDS:1 [Funneliformis geosporum]